MTTISVVLTDKILVDVSIGTTDGAEVSFDLPTVVSFNTVLEVVLAIVALVAIVVVAVSDWTVVANITVELSVVERSTTGIPLKYVLSLGVGKVIVVDGNVAAGRVAHRELKMPSSFNNLFTSGHA